MNLSSLRARAQRLKIEALALGLAVKHPGTPWYAKLMVAGLVAYAVTPVDLVPDFIPILGFIDDLIFVPLALGLAVRFVPAAVLDDCRGRAESIAVGARMNRTAWLLFLLVWVVVAAVGVRLALQAA